MEKLHGEVTQWIMALKFVLDYVQLWWRTTEVNEISVWDAPLTVGAPELALDIEIDAVRTEIGGLLIRG